MDRTLLAVSPVAHPGGAETTLLRFLGGLHERGWTVEMATPGPGALADAGARRGWPVHRLALGGLGRRRGARTLGAWPRARRLARRVDVIYLNGTVSGRLLPALGTTGARTVLHVHDMVDRAPRMWKRADVILAASSAVADRLSGLDAHVVYPPVDPEPPDIAPPWAPDRGGPIVGFVGRLEPRKGPLDLVRAATAIRTGAPGARVVLVGDDDYNIDPGYAAAVRCDDSVEHYGWVEGAAGLMRHLDVLVAPSHQEPAGTVLAEAMAVGTPVVATRVDGLPEVVQDGITGILVEPGAPDALAAAVLSVLDRREEMGAAAARWAQRFHTDRHVERVEALIAP